jgi:hypothetical protein
MVRSPYTSLALLGAAILLLGASLVPPSVTRPLPVRAATERRPESVAQSRSARTAARLPPTPSAQQQPKSPTPPTDTTVRKPARKPITREDFFDRQKQGQTIAHCVIEAEWLASALSPKALPAPAAPLQPPGDELVVLEDVEVHGDLVVGRAAVNR